MKNNAFTLAEVLITLGIIGVVAAFTLPTLISKYQEHVIISKYKKMYSTLANAYNLAIAENGSPDQWQVETRIDFLKKLEPYLNVSEECYNKVGCTTMGDYVSLSGEIMFGNFNNSTVFPKLRLNNGFSISMTTNPNPDCIYTYTDENGTTTKTNNVCAQCYGVITNTKSTKEYNVYGKDFFSFVFTKQAVMPTGYNASDYIVKANCNKSIHGSGNGDTCGTWILRFHNMDYLK